MTEKQTFTFRAVNILFLIMLTLSISTFAWIMAIPTIMWQIYYAYLIITDGDIPFLLKHQSLYTELYRVFKDFKTTVIGWFMCIKNKIMKTEGD